MPSDDRAADARRTLILTFHGVGDPPEHVGSDEEPVWVPRQSFEAVLDLVRGRSEVKITFDDGNASDADICLPELVDRDMKATFFVVAERLDQPRYLSRRQLMELASAGMGIGSHGLRHRPWGRLNSDELRAEVVEARDRLEQAVGCPVVEAACPFGSYHRRVLKMLREAGFDRVYTSDRGWTRADRWLQARNTLHHEDAVATASTLLESESHLGIAHAVKLALKRWR